MNEVIKIDPSLLFETYRADMINANNTAQQWDNMLKAASGAAVIMRKAGEQNFKIDVQVNGGLNLQQIYRETYQRFIREAIMCAKSKRPVSKLSEYQKFCICVACEVPVEMVGGSLLPNGSPPLMSKVRTTVPCSIVWEDGQYVVYYRKPEIDRTV